MMFQSLILPDIEDTALFAPYAIVKRRLCHFERNAPTRRMTHDGDPMSRYHSGNYE
jgi:hypothetical protein